MKRVKQALLIIVSFSFVFFWRLSPLNDYTIPMLGLLVFIFLVITSRNKNFNPVSSLGNNELMGVFILNAVILLLIFSTGEFSSPLFFLLYFLEFGIAFVFDPILVFIFLIATIGLFLTDALKDDSVGNFIRLGSLVFIAPLAYYFGKEYIDKKIDTPSTIKKKNNRKS